MSGSGDKTLKLWEVASHGTVDDGEYFLITSNVGSTRTEKLKTDAISQTAFKELIANIPTTKKLLVIDACSGMGFPIGKVR